MHAKRLSCVGILASAQGPCPTRSNVLREADRIRHPNSVHFAPRSLPLSSCQPVRSLLMKFRFPIVIIDEDFRSENTSGLGIRALALAIEAEGMEVLGVTSYGDLSQFAQQQSRASAFILSIDDEEFGSG